MSALTIAWVRTPMELAALEPDWWDLWRRVPDPTPFTSPAWLIPWWQAFAPGELLTLAVRDGGRLVALAPLWREEGALGRRLLPLGIGISDAFDLLIDPACADAGPCLAAALTASEGWDAISLEELPPGAAALNLHLDLDEERAEQSRAPILPLIGPEVGALVPARKRRKIAQARNRLARRDSGILRAGTMDDIAAIRDALFALHAARWRERGEEGVLADPRVQAFHRAAAPRLYEAGLLRLAMLVIDGRPAAAYYGLADARRFYGYLTGLDPAFAFESPGVGLLAAMLDDAIAEGHSEFSFLRGQEPYKYEWGAQDRPNLRRVLSRKACP